MKVVIYARCALHDKGGKSIEQQVNECCDYARKNSMTVIGKYIDDGFSGTNDNRPEFQRMIEDSKNKEFQGVLVYSLDRFARNRYDSAIYKAKLKKNGVKLLSARKNISDDASSILLDSIIEGMSEYYSMEKEEKKKKIIQMIKEL